MPDEQQPDQQPESDPPSDDGAEQEAPQKVEESPGGRPPALRTNMPPDPRR